MRRNGKMMKLEKKNYESTTKKTRKLSWKEPESGIVKIKNLGNLSQGETKNQKYNPLGKSIEKVDMNIDKHKELIPLTEKVDITGNYLVRRFKDDSGNYLIIDTYGDFLVLDKQSAGDVLTAIWDDAYSPTMSNEYLN